MKLLKIVLVAVALMGLLCGCTKTTPEPMSEPDASSAGQMTGMPNPVVPSTEEGVLEQVGVYCGLPETAVDVQYFVIGKTTEEVRFFVSGVPVTVRVQPTAEFTDISGYYIPWDREEPCRVGYCDGTVRETVYNGKAIRSCLWFDAAPGIMYCVSAEGDVPAEFDLVTIADAVFIPMQGDVG